MAIFPFRKIFSFIVPKLTSVYPVVKRNSCLFFLVVTISIVILSIYVLFLLYQVPSKTVTFETKTFGCVGYPSYYISAAMNYGDSQSQNDSTGFQIKIRHPFVANAPYLFRGNIIGEGVLRRDEYIKEYEPLCNRYCDVIDSISTLYKSIIAAGSNVYAYTSVKDMECWMNNSDVAIWRRTTEKKHGLIKSESWYYMKRKSRTNDTLCLEHRLTIPYDNFYPKWYSCGDVSKLEFKLKLNDYDLLECKGIFIKFNGPYILASTTMEADKQGYDYFLITNPYKLKIISRKGLSMYASFPKLEKLQHIRITVLMLVIPLIMSLGGYLLKRYLNRC